MTFPKFHGITLAQNAWIANAVVESLASDPTPIVAGRIWFNSTAKTLSFSSLDSGGAVVVQTFASGADITTALAAITALGARVTTLEGAFINKDGSVAFTGNVDAGSNKVVNVANGTLDSDAVNKAQLDAAIGNLANAFDYIGVVAGGVDTGSALDLTTESSTKVGSYYKVTTAGYFKVGAEGTPFFANVNDGLVFNTTAGVDIIDNQTGTVTGTASYIDVTGTAATGFTVDIDSTFKGRVSTLETGLTAETARAEGVEGDLTALTTSVKTDLVSAINAEAARAATAEGVNATAISTETSRATTAEGVLTASASTNAGAISAEVTRATGVEGSLASLTGSDKSSLVNAINAEQVRATAAEAGFATTASLATEVSRAEAAEGDLTTLTTTAQGSLVAAINEVDADVATNTSGLAAEIIRATGAEGTLTTNLAAEVARAEGVEGTLASLTTAVKTDLVSAINSEAARAATAEGTNATAISTETTRATTAEGVNAAAISTETTRATGAEGTLTTNLAAEVSRATTAEGTLTTDLGDITTLTTTDKSSAVAAINELVAAAGEGAGALKAAINAQRFTYLAVTGALSYVISHSLNSAYVAVTVLVKGDDGVFRNDMVAVEETDANTTTVTLTESRIIKATFQALDQMA